MEKVLSINLIGRKYNLYDQIALPFLLIADIPSFIEQSKIVGQTAVRLFQTRIREVLPDSDLKWAIAPESNWVVPKQPLSVASKGHFLPRHSVARAYLI